MNSSDNLIRHFELLHIVRASGSARSNFSCPSHATRSQPQSNYRRSKVFFSIAIISFCRLAQALWSEWGHRISIYCRPIFWLRSSVLVRRDRRACTLLHMHMHSEFHLNIFNVSPSHLGMRNYSLLPPSK
ncbi:hypothetical protein L208DRAFT_821641 [Tricholoma matsutake]|nr:hypothetical protein L208DRAFT_821641 [Tricholoma matsutake 945]